MAFDLEQDIDKRFDLIERGGARIFSKCNLLNLRQEYKGALERLLQEIVSKGALLSYISMKEVQTRLQILRSQIVNKVDDFIATLEGRQPSSMFNDQRYLSGDRLKEKRDH